MSAAPADLLSMHPCLQQAMAQGTRSWSSPLPFPGQAAVAPSQLLLPPSPPQQQSRKRQRHSQQAPGLDNAAVPGDNNVAAPQPHAGNHGTTAAVAAMQLTAQPQPAAQQQHVTSAGVQSPGLPLLQGLDEQHQPMQQCDQSPQRDGVQVSEQSTVYTCLQNVKFVMQLQSKGHTAVSM